MRIFYTDKNTNIFKPPNSLFKKMNFFS